MLVCSGRRSWLWLSMGWGDGVDVDFDPLDFFELCTVVGRATKGAASIKHFPVAQSRFSTLKNHGMYSMWNAW
jgi:hypothetical protein